MKNNITEIVFILDMSGSMSPMTDDTIGGFNTCIKNQKGKEDTALVTTVVFNNDNYILHDRVNIDEVPEMTEKQYSAGGSTALIDAMGDTIKHIEKIHKYIRPEDVPRKTLFMITTDGMENSSHKYSADEVKKLVESKTEEGWEFVYMAANIDAVETAKAYGIRSERAVNQRHTHYAHNAKFRAMDACMSSVRLCKSIEESDWRRELDEDFTEGR